MTGETPTMPLVLKGNSELTNISALLSMSTDEKRASDFRDGLAGWHPTRREIWAKAITPSYLGIASVGSPGETPQVGATFPANTYDIYYSPDGKSAVYVKDTDGNEQFQVYAYD